MDNESTTRAAIVLYIVIEDLRIFHVEVANQTKIEILA